MRKPPDKPGQAQVSSVSEREVDTSNATLNTLFGSAHQKSWMTAMAPVRPTPRRTPSAVVAQPRGPPPPTRAPEPNPVRRTTAPVLAVPTTRDDPGLDATRSRPNGECSENIRPGASISNEQQRNTITSPVRKESDRANVLPLPHLRPGNTSESGQGTQTTTSQQGNQFGMVLEENHRIPRIEPQGRARDQERVQREGRIQTQDRIHDQAGSPARQTMQSESVDFQETGTRFSPTMQHVFTEEQDSAAQLLQSPSPDILSPVMNPAETSRAASSRSTSFNTAVPRPALQVPNPSTQWQRRPSPIQVDSSPEGSIASPSLASPFFQNPNGRAEGQTHTSSAIAGPSPRIPAEAIHVQKRQRTSPPAMPSLKPCIALIDAHIASVGGEPNLNTGLERPRFMLLREACSKEDIFYVATHQLFCTWDCDPSPVTSILGFPPKETLRAAFKILGQLIRDNSQLAPNHRVWFARFPSPLSDLLTTSEPYRRTVDAVGRFLTRLATDWVTFANDTRSRKYPPLVDELVTRLGILSPIFQGIVFTATRRNLGVGDDLAGDQMEQMFQKDRQEYLALSARMSTERPPTEQEISERNGRLAGEYYSLLRQVHRRRQSSSSIAGSLGRVPTPGSSHQQATASPVMNPNIQRLQQPAPYLGTGSAPASPDPLLANGQSPVIAPPWRTSAGSPSIGMPAFGRPTSLNSPQLSTSTNSPSPHLIQNMTLPNQSTSQAPLPRSNDNDAGMQNAQQNNQQNWGQPVPPNSSNQAPPQNFAAQNTAAQQYGGPPGPASPNPFHQQYAPNQQQHQQQNQQQSRQQNPQYSQPLPQQNPLPHNQIPQQLQTVNNELYQITQARQQGSILSGQQSPQFDQNILQREQYLLRQQVNLRNMMSQISQQQQLLQQMGSSSRMHQNPLPSLQNSTSSSAYSNGQFDPNYQSVPSPADPRNPPQNGQIPRHVRTERNGSMSGISHPHGVGPGPGPGPGSRQFSNTGVNYPSQAASQPGVSRANHPHRVQSEGVQRMLSLTDAYEQTPLLARSIVPPYYYPQPTGPPQPSITALHQAHLRSPHLRPLKPIPKDLPLDHPDRRYYQVVTTFAVPPTKLHQANAMAHFNFSVSAKDFPMVARRQPAPEKEIPVRGFVAGSLQYRLRCIEKKKPGNECSLQEWALQDSLWPDNAVFQLEAANMKQQIELRRKKLHGKDLPVDLTDYVAMFGPNTNIRITMSIPGRRLHLKEKNIFLAVEVVEMMTHRGIMDAAQLRRRPKNVTMDAIIKSLAGPITSADDEEDDDIALVSADLTLDVTDPFSARIFSIPVRADECLHRECFDLETYLLSRVSKPNRKGQPSTVDVWRCPLCRGDARPQCLYVDEFLVEVRRALGEQGALDVKSVLVDREGRWKPKGVPGGSNGSGGASGSAGGSGNGKRKSMNDDDNNEESESEDEELPPMGRAARQKQQQQNQQNQQNQQQQRPVARTQSVVIEID